MNNSIKKCIVCNNEKTGEFITINDKKYHLCCIENLQQERNNYKELYEKEKQKYKEVIEKLKDAIKECWYMDSENIGEQVFLKKIELQNILKEV